MGCDIHLFVEVKDENGWRKLDIDEVRPLKVLSKEEKKNLSDEEARENWLREYDDSDFYVGRNYDLFAILADVRNGSGFADLFAILADVRNGSGFAGCDLGDRVEPLSGPRGLPYDVSVVIEEESENWGDDAHSHSFFTLKELLDVPWKEKKHVHRGYVTQEVFATMKPGEGPSEWCGDVGGGSVKKITVAEMAMRVANNEPDDGNTYYTQVQWETDWTWSAGSFLTRTIPLMQKAAELFTGGDTEAVRTVFWFDN